MSLDEVESGALTGDEAFERAIGEDVAVEIQNVTKEYDDVVAVDDVSINIREQEFLTILGPSGAGKTTLLHILAGFVKPTSGRVRINGRDVTDKPPYERNIGLVFQSMALFPHMTVEENIAFPLKMRRWDRDRIDERVAEMLDLIRLPDIGHRQISELSGGQQQRVATARGLAFEPSLLLLDEPLSALDKKLREEMRHEIMRIHRESEVTTVHVTHNQEEALTLADRIAVIKGGRIVQHSPPHELHSRPNSAFLADFVGNSNLLSGTVSHVDGQSCTVAVDGGSVDIACTTERSEETVEVGDDVTVAMRYEEIQIGEELDTDNVYDTTIDEVLFRGDLIHYTVDIPGVEPTIHLTELNQKAKLYERGETIKVGWNEADTLVYRD